MWESGHESRWTLQKDVGIPPSLSYWALTSQDEGKPIACYSNYTSLYSAGLPPKPNLFILETSRED